MALQEEEEKKKQGLDFKEKQAEYHRMIDNLDREVYNRPYLNDQLLNFDKFTTSAPKELSTLQRWLYVKPFYRKYSESQPEMPIYHYFLHIFGGALLMKLGYNLGIREANEANQSLAKSKVVEFESEEQIFNELYNKQKDGVLLHFYSPGHSTHQNFMRAFEEASSDEQYKDIVFMNVHCRKHLNFCLNKTFIGRVSPFVELYYINEQDKIELMDMDTRHRSKQGLRSFLEQSNLIETKFDPGDILERTGLKLKEIV